MTKKRGCLWSFVLAIGVVTAFGLYKESTMTPAERTERSRVESLKDATSSRKSWTPVNPVVLEDGTTIAIKGLRVVDDWAQGKRAVGRLDRPDQTLDVVLYYNAKGDVLQTIRVPGADNIALYERGVN